MESVLEQLDETDKEIISLLQNQPDMTNQEISKIVKKSQPAVGARILKLKRASLLETQIGVNYKHAEVRMAKAEMIVKDTVRISKKLKKCPFVVQVMKQTGTDNISVLFAGLDYDIIGDVIDCCYRADRGIKKMDVNYIISMEKDAIYPLNFAMETFNKESGCINKCLKGEEELEMLKELVRNAKKPDMPIINENQNEIETITN